MERKIVKEIKDRIEKANAISLISHERPDGDAIGSLIAMGLGIERIGKKVKLLSPDDVPEVYRFLKGTEKIEKLNQLWNERADICIFIDTANPSRLGNDINLKSLGKFIINIDHHIDNKRYGDINFVDPTASSTGELIYEILSQWENLITPEIADALYTAIVTDSGRFSYESTSYKTHLIAADLLSKGANKTIINKRIYEIKPFNVLKLIGEMLSRAQLAFGGKVIWSFITLESFEKHGVNLLDSEGFLQFLRMAEGIKLAILFREIERGKIRVSLRSTDKETKVREIATQFGGGGHEMAAGCTIEANLESAKELLFKSIEEKYGWKA